MAFPVGGLVVGFAAAVGLTRLLQASLYETSPVEPRVFGTMAAVLIAVSVLASAIPAWRATRADPAETLRDS
jgi:ABC-type antimicrobial peptide transport system permease subunit